MEPCPHCRGLVRWRQYVSVDAKVENVTQELGRLGEVVEEEDGILKCRYWGRPLPEVREDQRS